MIYVVPHFTFHNLAGLLRMIWVNLIMHSYFMMTFESKHLTNFDFLETIRVA